MNNAINNISNDSHRQDFVSLITRARTDTEMISLAAQCILQEFDDYYSQFCRIPAQAQEAFEQRNPQKSLSLSKQRLNIYSQSITQLGAMLEKVFPLLAYDEQRWLKVEEQYLPVVSKRYEEDLARAYLQSVRRKFFREEWRPLEYFSDKEHAAAPIDFLKSFEGGAQLTSDTVEAIVLIPGFTAIFRNLKDDCIKIADHINAKFELDGNNPKAIQTIIMHNGGFFRNRGAYLVGKMVLQSMGPETVP
ncbi:MAG: hypothetical protein HON65_08715, partial [Rhodospirillales bacterium]|nr:hypothetical protein [Rhodospirillales bacterium]